MISIHSDEWRIHALCRGADVNRFFPVPGTPSSMINEIRELCKPCPVRLNCLELGMSNGNEDHGIFGGKTVRERRAIRYERNRHSRTKSRGSDDHEPTETLDMGEQE